MLATLLVLATLSATDAETARIQAHLAGAEAELRAADISALTPRRRALRARVIDELARYRGAARFPRNLDFAELTPYFIDDRGVRCAMAHLVETFGGGAFVARVAATANNARIAELAADRELLAWLDAHGLTVAEAARIQPAYRNEVGMFCGTNEGCLSDLCLTAPGRPDSARFCSMPCDPAAPACPVGQWDVQMTCELIGDRFLCVYPGQTPGTEGYPCDVFGEYFCYGALVCFNEHPDDRDGVCTRQCGPFSDYACADTHECLPWMLNPDIHVCQEVARDDGGCNATGAASPLVLAVLLARRRGRRRVRRDRAATSSCAASSASSTS